MKTHLLSSARLTLVLIFIFSGIYPLFISAIGKLSTGEGNGARLEAGGRITGYENIGQSFTADRYFQGRPSAVNYNAASSGGSNKGPSNPALLSNIQARIDTFTVHNPGIEKSQIPVDLVTASGSGLDPHISVAAAIVQSKRIARQRGIKEETIRNLVDRYTETPLLGLFGPSRINVLKINLALDELKPLR